MKLEPKVEHPLLQWLRRADLLGDLETGLEKENDSPIVLQARTYPLIILNRAVVHLEQLANKQMVKATITCLQVDAMQAACSSPELGLTLITEPGTVCKVDWEPALSAVTEQMRDTNADR